MKGIRGRDMVDGPSREEASSGTAAARTLRGRARRAVTLTILTV